MATTKIPRKIKKALKKKMLSNWTCGWRSRDLKLIRVVTNHPNKHHDFYAPYTLGKYTCTSHELGRN